MLKHEFQNILRTTDPAEFRKFGLSVGSVVLVLGVVLIWRGITGGPAMAVIGGTCVLIALLQPRLLKFFYRGWMLGASMLGWIMTRVLLSLIYYLLFTPVALFLRLFKVKVLDRTIDPEAHSYWLPRSTGPYSPSDSEKQY